MTALHSYKNGPCPFDMCIFKACDLAEVKSKTTKAQKYVKYHGFKIHENIPYVKNTQQMASTKKNICLKLNSSNRHMMVISVQNKQVDKSCDWGF